VVFHVGLGKGLERDVGLLADLVPALENPDTFRRLELLGFLLIGGLGRVAIARRFTLKS
jgi:hypothetical protein